MLELNGSGAGPLEDEDPRWIGPIPLVGRLGAGGMGRVYLGVHEGRYAAVKQLLPSVVAEDKDFLRRFGHELDNLARLPEEATAPLLAGDREARPPWFATAYVPGLTLREALEAHGGPLPAEALWLILREAAKGLAAVHGLDMVHRDLKPSNVMLTLDGLTLIDFGVARAAEQSQLTRTGMVVGTPAYMSPEQASGSRASSGVVDVFALGSVLAYAASGRPPFGDESGHAVLYRIVHEAPDLDVLRDLDPELADVVASCLDKDHEGRPTAAELLDIAERHGPYEPPLWPEAVTGLLSERAAFAGTLPDAADLPEPDAEPGGGTTEPGEAKQKDQKEQKEQEDQKGRKERGERRGRRQVLFALVPVVVVAGSTLAIQLLPFSADSDAEAGTGPTSSVSAPPAPQGSPSASASGTGSPTASASSSASSSSSPGAQGPGSDNGTADGGSSGSGSGGDANGSAGSAGSNGSDGSDGSKDSDGGAGGGGSSGSDGSDGSAGSGDAGAPSSGWFVLKNGEDGTCLTQAFSAADTGSCTGAAARWTFRSGANGAVKVVNESGSCLSANMKGQAVFTADCASDGTAVLWRSGAGGTLRSVFNDGCLDLAFGSGVDAQTCESGQSSQQWKRT
ncbi:serine/threonine-protein kinase [Streptomyces olivaceus]|uniref:serine/threonine-protein kinase n=1 Tax=Streptomyces olivaceus TaxID=47716 RepID=UPI001CC9BE75|nr:serine/threonine-protein kinase [Streptomyces olivaceus]MBZ6288041.1 protein kinase [Streptomyces olivaceus]